MDTITIHVFIHSLRAHVTIRLLQIFCKFCQKKKNSENFISNKLYLKMNSKDYTSSFCERNYLKNKLQEKNQIGVLFTADFKFKTYLWNFQRSRSNTSSNIIKVIFTDSHSKVIIVQVNQNDALFRKLTVREIFDFFPNQKLLFKGKISPSFLYSIDLLSLREFAYFMNDQLLVYVLCVCATKYLCVHILPCACTFP